MMMVKLEVDGAYKSRGGLRADVISHELDGHSDHIPYFVKYSDGAEYYLSEDGRVWQTSESPRDLIAELTDTPAEVISSDVESINAETMPEAYSEIIEKVNIAEAAFNEMVECSEEEDREIFMQYNNEGAIKVFMQEMHDKAFPSSIYEKRTDPENQPRSKYHRIIKGVELDIYDILVAWGVTCPARQHAIKKLFMAGERGAKGVVQDLDEAIQATERAKELV